MTFRMRSHAHMLELLSNQNLEPSPSPKLDFTPRSSRTDLTEFQSDIRTSHLSRFPPSPRDNSFAVGNNKMQQSCILDNSFAVGNTAGPSPRINDTSTLEDTDLVSIVYRSGPE